MPRVAGWGMALWAACSAVTAQPTPPTIPTAKELTPSPTLNTDPRLVPEPQTPPRRAAAPDQLEIDVAGYTVSESAPAELRAALAAITAPYVGPKKSYEDLIGAADDVTRFLNRELGYYLGYAYIPEQEPKDGRIRIEVLEGRLDKIVWNWPSKPLPVDRDFVERYADALKPGAILRVRDVERVVFLVNDLRGIVASFEVKAGSLPGTASLVITPSADPSKPGKVDVDLNGSRFLGSERVGGLWGWNSLAGRGDALTVNALTSANGGLGFALVGYTRPVGSDGLKLGGSLSFIRYKLDETEFPLGVNGDATNFTGYALYPWVRSRNLNLFVLGSVDHKDYTDRRDVAGTVDKKKVDSFTFGITGDFRDNVLTGGVNSYELNVSSGRVNYPEGIPAGLDDAPSYRKVNLTFNRLQNLVTSRLLFYVSMRAQFAMDNLDTSEQFRLGGPDSIRAFAPGEGTGDTGYVGTAELRWLPPESLMGRLARETVFSLFYDTGRITFRQDATGRPANFVNTASFSGAGISVSWAHGTDYAFRMSIAKPISGTPKADTLVRDPRLYAQFTKFF